jgi:uncharacterized protein (DUF58 family)
MSDELSLPATPPPAEGIATTEELLTPEFMGKLEHLSLVVTRAFAGRMHGERRSIRRGTSVEFADYRNYVLGDDLRYVDWNVYARLEKLFLKLYIDEEDLHVHLLIDTSRSMGFGAPGKLLAACRVAAALGYIALASFDRLSVSAFNDRLGTRMRTLRGKGNASTLFTWLKGLSADGVSDFTRVFSDYALLARRPGPVIIISDFFAPGLEEGLRSIVGRKFAPTLLRVLAPEEVEPPYTGDLRLVDSETGDTREITITGGVLARYKQRLQAHREWLEGVAGRFGVNYIETATDEPFENLVLRYLKARRIVQ